MSADEFDSDIERLFNRAPDLADSSAFEARVMSRLHSTSRVRGLALGFAGLVGGFIAFGELIGLSVAVGDTGLKASISTGGESVGSAVRSGSMAAQGMMESLGISRVDLGALSQTETFLAVSCVMLTALALGAVKLYQQV